MASRGIKNGLFVVGNIIKNIYEEKDDVLRLEPDITSSGKITKMMSKFIITPNIVVDDNLKYMDVSIFRDLVKTELMTFTAIVSQAVRVMIEIHGVEPVVAINKLNSSSLQDDASKLLDITRGNEDFDYVGDLLNKETILPATEASNHSKLENNNYIQKDVSSFINSYELQVSFSNKNGDARVLTLPIIIYPNITYTNANSLLNNLVDSKSGKYLSDVINDYRAGLKSFLDIITATSLVKEYRKQKITNNNDFAKYLNKVDKVSTFKDLLHNRNSFSKNFNIYILGSENEATINKLIKGNIHKDKYKDDLTDKLMAFSVTLVDIEREELTYFIDSIPGFSVLSFNMLKKEKDADMGKILKEMMHNKPPF